MSSTTLDTKPTLPQTETPPEIDEVKKDCPGRLDTFLLRLDKGGVTRWVISGISVVVLLVFFVAVFLRVFAYPLVEPLFVWLGSHL